MLFADKGFSLDKLNKKQAFRGLFFMGTDWGRTLSVFFRNAHFLSERLIIEPY
ncbi:hypothetical protein [Bacillus altitudinis]|uniref:hypothetical protein n=1 Tax=Bacillus altitudinis TaxID=293387 RepID=UPI001F252632|nr:hypothetical protein [Bacillus altitudinis]